MKLFLVRHLWGVDLTRGLEPHLAQQARGADETTLTPEFGPPPYLHTLLCTQQPVAGLEAICDWMALRQAQHLASWSSGQKQIDQLGASGSRSVHTTGSK